VSAPHFYDLTDPRITLEFEMIDGEHARAVVVGPRTVWATTRVAADDLTDSGGPEVRAAHAALCSWRDHMIEDGPHDRTGRTSPGRASTGWASTGRTVDLSVVEERIMELCRRAKTELGWTFSHAKYASSGGIRGCALEACAVVLDVPSIGAPGSVWPNWSQAGEDLGLRNPLEFAFGFDRAMSNVAKKEPTMEAALGRRVALRIMKELTP